jgi:hypothetical protein
MASNFHLSQVAANAAAGDGTNKGVLGLLTQSGYTTTISFYGNSQPSTPETAAGATALASGTLPTPTMASGALTFLSIPNINVSNSGTANWFRITSSNGTTTNVICDGDVGVTGSGDDITFGTNVWSSGGVVTIAQIVLTITNF